MLGSQQKAFIKKWFCSPVSGYRMDVVYSERYLNTRETGTGYPVILKIIHVASGDVESRFEVARCQSESACEKKVAEINKYIEQLMEEWLDVEI